MRRLMLFIAVMALLTMGLTASASAAKKTPTGSFLEPPGVTLTTGPDGCSVRVTYGLDGSGRRQVAFDFFGDGDQLGTNPAGGIITVKSKTTSVTVSGGGQTVEGGEGLQYTGTSRQVDVTWDFTLSYDAGKKKSPDLVVLDTATGSRTVSVPANNEGTCEFGSG